MITKQGWWVDWDGITRTTSCPTSGYKCIVTGDIVEVVKSDGEVIFEATFWPDFDKLEQCLNDAGCFVRWH